MQYIHILKPLWHHTVIVFVIGLVTFVVVVGLEEELYASNSLFYKQWRSKFDVTILKSNDKSTILSILLVFFIFFSINLLL